MNPNLSKHTPSKKTPGGRTRSLGLLSLGLILSGLILLTILSSWPFIANASLPADNDAELHIYRIAEMGYSLNAGILYPRWAPDFYHGYGYPIFNYYAPLTYHLGHWLSLGRPQMAVETAKVLFIGTHMLGILGAYQLGKTFGGRGGGLLGATAFAFSPYVQFINPHVRGGLAEVVALGILPWVLWSWRKVWQGAGLKFGVLAILSTAATLLSHNLTGLTMLGLIGGLSIWHLAIHGHRHTLRNALLVGVTFVLLTAFFWLPFLLERQYIQLEDVTGEGHYDYRQHFVPLPELLKLLPQQDYRASAPMAPMTVGPQILILAFLGCFVVLLTRQDSLEFIRSDLAFFGLGALFSLWLTHRSSAWIWRHIPGFIYFQFPWRFLGPLATLLVPLVAGVGALRRGRRRTVVLAISIGVLILLGLPGLYPRSWQSSWEPIDRLAIIKAELADRWRGTTSTNDFVPRTVQMIPGPEDSVLESYRNPPIDRVNRHTLPEETSVQVIPDKPHVNRLRVSGNEAFTLRLYLFDFPGWTAYVDGQEVPIELANPEGFITVDVPAGRHEVVVRFESTPARRTGWALTVAGGILGLIGMPTLYRAVDTEEEPQEMKDRDPIVIPIVIIGLFLVANGLVFDPYGWFRYTSDSGQARPAETTQYAAFGNKPDDVEVKLLGYDLSHEEVKPDRTLNLTLYWMAARPMTQTYQSFVHVIGPDGELWGQSDHLNPAGYPTDRWPLDRYIRDRHQLTLQSEAPEGTYTLHVGLYLLKEDRRLNIVEASEGNAGNAVILSQQFPVTR
jgi:hypothetical protein